MNEHEPSTLRWLWKFGLVRSLLAGTLTAVTLAMAAFGMDVAPEQWSLLQLVLAFYFAGAVAQGAAAQGAAAARSDGRDQGGSG